MHHGLVRIISDRPRAKGSGLGGVWMASAVLWFALSGGRQERSPQLPLKPSFTQVLEVELGSPSGAARALMY